MHAFAAPEHACASCSAARSRLPQVLTDYEALPRVFHNVETSQVGLAAGRMECRQLLASAAAVLRHCHGCCCCSWLLCCGVAFWGVGIVQLPAASQPWRRRRQCAPRLRALSCCLPAAEWVLAPHPCCPVRCGTTRRRAASSWCRRASGPSSCSGAPASGHVTMAARLLAREWNMAMFVPCFVSVLHK